MKTLFSYVPRFFAQSTVAAIFLTAAGCGGQKGCFSTSQTVSDRIGANNALLTVFSGHRLNGLGFEAGPEIPMFGLVVLPPALTEGSHSSDADFGTYETTYREAWAGQGQKWELNVVWDRQNDRIKLNGSGYPRKHGSTLVAVPEPGGTWKQWHVELASASFVTGDVARELISKLPADVLAKLGIERKETGK